MSFRQWISRTFLDPPAPAAPSPRQPTARVRDSWGDEPAADNAFGAMHSAAPFGVVDPARTVRDGKIARIKLPPNTTETEVEGTTYWTYTFNCQFGQSYVMTAYFDGAEYQVKVLEPRRDPSYSIHNTHWFPDGRICLNPPANGASSLDEAYAKSVIWATGLSVFKEVGKFPFSSNNE